MDVNKFYLKKEGSSRREANLIHGHLYKDMNST